MATGPGGGFSISSFLDRYETGAPASATSGQKSSSNGRGSDIRRNGDGGRDGGLKRDRPAPIGVPGRNLKGNDTKSGTASPLNTFAPPVSKALDATQAANAGEKKRKFEENGTDVPKKRSRFEGMTKEQKIAEVKRLKALKAARDAAKSSGAPGRDGNGSGSAASNPNSPITAEAPRKPAKGSYAEIMERAKQLQATSAAPAKIIHKETKVERKKLAAKGEKPEPGRKTESGKRPGAAPPKAQNGKSVAPSSSSKQSPVKRTVGRPGAKKPDPPKPAESRLKAPQVEWKGTARPSAVAQPAPSKPSSSRPSERDRDRSRDRDRERERDRDRSWERDRERARYRSPVKRYRYAESEEEDYYSDSDDMEAAGIDILDEEEFSHEVGRREDLEAEKLERELQAKKAKRMIGRR